MNDRGAVLSLHTSLNWNEANQTKMKILYDELLLLENAFKFKLRNVSIEGP